MHRLAADRAEGLRLGARAAALMQAEFDGSVQVARHVDLYERLVSEVRRRGHGRRVALPSDLGDVARRALWHPGNFPEMSLLELLEALADALDLAQGPVGQRVRLGLLARLDAFKEALPPPVRWTIRRAFVRVAAGLLATRRGRRGYERWLERRRQLDDRALRAFGGGAGLDRVTPAWTRRDLAAHLDGADRAPARARGLPGRR